MVNLVSNVMYIKKTYISLGTCEFMLVWDIHIFTYRFSLPNALLHLTNPQVYHSLPWGLTEIFMVIPVDLESLPVFGLTTLPSTYALAGNVNKYRFNQI